MKIVFIPTEVSGVTFYRMWQPANAMREQGHNVALLWYRHDHYLRHEWEWEINNTEHSGRITEDIDMACEWADVVVWSALHTQEALSYFQQMRVKHVEKTFVTEFDDTVFSVPASNLASTVYYPGSSLSQISTSQIGSSDALVVSTPYLKQEMSKYHPNIYVVENVIDLNLWRRELSSPSSARRRLTIGWVGGGTHTEDLRLVQGVITDLVTKYRHVRFFCAHGCPEFFKHQGWCPNLNTNNPRYNRGVICPTCGGMRGVKWTHDFKPINRYPRWVKGLQFDIGIAPLVDNTFNRGKSNLRWLEYSALGIPTVASPLPNFQASIRHGETGFIANCDLQWREYLEELILNPSLRKGVGKAAHDEVKKNWNTKVMGMKYAQALKGLINARSRQGCAAIAA